MCTQIMNKIIVGKVSESPQKHFYQISKIFADFILKKVKEESKLRFVRLEMAPQRSLHQ